MSEKHLTFSKIKGWEVPNLEYLRSYANWNEKELEALIESVKNNTHIEQISKTHCRSVNAIKSKLYEIYNGEESISKYIYHKHQLIKNYLAQFSFIEKRKIYPNYGKWWTDDEIGLLARLIKKQKTPAEICKQMGRSPRAIYNTLCWNIMCLDDVRQNYYILIFNQYYNNVRKKQKQTTNVKT